VKNSKFKDGNYFFQKRNQLTIDTKNNFSIERAYAPFLTIILFYGKQAQAMKGQFFKEFNLNFSPFHMKRKARYL
jgi:hypothetical protein